MKKSTFSIKRDKFKSARGGNSKLLNVCCRKCENIAVVYQKDGPGDLHRLYMDRICAPEDLVGLQRYDVDSVSVLRCKNCAEVLATPYIYMKEKRPAFRLHQDSIIKRLKK